jgi:hypothetical protein
MKNLMDCYVQMMKIVALVAITAGMVMFCYRGCEIVIVHVYTTEEQAFSHKEPEAPYPPSFSWDNLPGAEYYDDSNRTKCNRCGRKHLCLDIIQTLD